jgi:hypothetical protein
VNALPGFNAFGGIVDTVFEEVEYAAGKDLAADEFYYTEIADSSPKAYEAYTNTKAPEDTNVKLYQKYTTYTVPSGSAKVTGEYVVKAVNTIGVNHSNEEPSSVCRLVSPDDVTFSTDLDDIYVMAAAGGNLKVVVNEQASDDAVVTYAWRKNIKSGERTEEQKDNWEIHENTNVANSNVLTPGWYDVTVSATLNREEKVATSGVCKVTFDPKLPAMEYAEGVHFNEGDTVPTFSGASATLTVEHPYGVFATAQEYADYNSYANELFSEKLEYIWKITLQDQAERPLVQADVDSGLVDALGNASITIHTPERMPATVTCYVTNVLNGKVATSDATNSLAFYID